MLFWPNLPHSVFQWIFSGEFILYPLSPLTGPLRLELFSGGSASSAWLCSLWCLNHRAALSIKHTAIALAIVVSTAADTRTARRRSLAVGHLRFGWSQIVAVNRSPWVKTSCFTSYISVSIPGYHVRPIAPVLRRKVITSVRNVKVRQFLFVWKSSWRFAPLQLNFLSSKPCLISPPVGTLGAV